MHYFFSFEQKTAQLLIKYFYVLFYKYLFLCKFAN